MISDSRQCPSCLVPRVYTKIKHLKSTSHSFFFSRIVMTSFWWMLKALECQRQSRGRSRYTDGLKQILPWWLLFGQHFNKQQHVNKKATLRTCLKKQDWEAEKVLVDRGACSTNKGHGFLPSPKDCPDWGALNDSMDVEGHLLLVMGDRVSVLQMQGAKQFLASIRIVSGIFFIKQNVFPVQANAVLWMALNSSVLLWTFSLFL